MKIHSFQKFLQSTFNIRISSIKNLIRNLFTVKLFYLYQIIFVLFALSISKVAAQQNCPIITLSPLSNFNASPNSAPTTLWFNLHTKLNGSQLIVNGDYLLFSGGTLSFTGVNTSFGSSVSLPTGEIIADNTVSVPSTSFNMVANSWVTRVPPGYNSNDLFLSGAAITSSTGFTLSRRNNSTTLAGNISSNKSISSTWFYGLACYQPTFTNSTIGTVNANNGIPVNGLKTGTPDNQISRLVKGGSGNGGSNYTGNYSSNYNFATCINTPPTSNAGSNQTLNAGTTSATLVGSGTDANGTIASYSWKQTTGASATITSPSSATTTVTGLSAGSYTFQLTVTDNFGTTGTSSVNVAVNANVPPVANAGTNQTLNAGITSVTLVGSGTDANGTIASYSWKQTAGASAKITSPSSATTTVTGLSAGSYTFQLTVTDNLGATGTSTVNVTVASSKVPPVANAGSNQTLNVGTTSTTLSGSASGGSGNYSYLWTKTSGATCTISNNSQASTNVTGLTAGSYIFNLLVTDLNNNATANSTVQITVSSSGTSGSTQLNHGNSNPYTVSGQSYNLQSENNDYNGVIADRSSQYQFNFLYNFITSNIISGGGGAGYMLQFGEESTGPSNWYLNGMVVSGNYLSWTGGAQSPPVEPHGVFAGAFNADVKMTYNYLDQVPMALIEKSDGVQYNSINRLTSGGICYNIINSPQYSGVNIKGMANTNVYNNTFYSNTGTGNLIDIYDNTGTNGVGYGTHIYNNIFYTTSTSTTNICVETSDCQTGFISDYNVFYCASGAPQFRIGNTLYTFTQWQALGYDAHSIVVNPNLLDFTNFVPSAPLYYGTNLGAGWQTGLAANGVWSTSAMPATANQGSTWQVGARIISQSGSLTAYAGSNQTLPAGTTSTTLNGSASESNVTYNWTQTSGATAAITTPSSATTMVTGLTGGTFTFLITVSDNSGNIATSSDTISVNTSSTLASGLISYWKLDELSGQAIDATGAGGNNNNGTQTNTTQGVAGKINTAYAFNGTSSKVDMGNPVNLSLASAGSLSCWVYPSINASDGIVASKGNFSSDTYGYGIDYVGGTNQFLAELANGSAHQTVGFNGTTIALNTWYHLVLTWDGANFKTYLNGNVTSVVQQLVPVSNVNDFVLGYNYATGTAYFNGRIDEVGVWNRALTSAEVIALYSSGTGISYPFGQTTNLATIWNPYSSAQISNVTASSVRAYPNPYSSEIDFNLRSSITGQGSLVIYDVLGREITKVFEGDFVAGSEKTVSYKMRKTGREPLIYIFKIGSEIIQGKLLPGRN
jgi:hypothetical protein